MWYASSEKWATSAFTSSRAPGQSRKPFEAQPNHLLDIEPVYSASICAEGL
ncbi:hypothetical protein V3C99_009290, partial [Haemonchus contortus]